MADIVISAREIQEHYRGDLRALEAVILRSGGTRAQDVLAGRPVRPPKPESQPKAIVAMRVPIPTEEEEQAAFFARCDSMSGAYPNLRWIFAVPNGGHRHKATAARLRAQGVRAGVSDVLYLVPRGGFHGLALEFKRRRGGMTSPLQEAFLAWSRGNGYRAEVVRGCEEAWRILCDYDQSIPQEGER